ncbi:MAG: hypothetical protein ACOC32_01070 [Nanoarchaeota archaeon]
MASNVINKEPLSLTEVKDALDKVKKRDEELNFRSNKTYEFVKSLPLLTKKDYTALYKKIEELEIPRLKDFHIKKIIDVMPVNADDLKMLLSGYTLTVNSDNMKKIIEALKEFKK